MVIYCNSRGLAALLGSKLRFRATAPERLKLNLAETLRERGSREGRGRGKKQRLTRELEILETFFLGRCPAFLASHKHSTPSPYT